MNTLILCNGAPPSRKLFDHCRQWAHFFIAADGGGNIALGFEEEPDVVIGDLDSFKEREIDTLEVVFDPDQETNDLEKALNLAVQERAKHVVVLGATGQQLDQTLKNLSVLKQFNSLFNTLEFRDNFGDVSLLPKSFSGMFDIGTIVSLFPLSGKVTGITTDGLKYPLKGEKLENGIRDGSSNEVVSKPVNISYENGDLLMFISR